VFVQVVQSLVVLVFAPLYAGALARAEAVIGSKRGPSVLQPYRDLAKLLRKGSVVSDQASWIFRGAPFVVFACYLTVSVIVPVITYNPLPLAFLADLIGGAYVLTLASFMTSLAGLDTASPHGGLGASRASWIGSMAEPALILVFFAVAALAGKLALCGAVIVVIGTSFAKLRFFRIAEFLGAAFLLALVGVATSYVIGA
jgi:formate hydrogenlyase subunit 4